ncbi:MAG: hydrogenase maturation protease [Anaerolineae bacterium]|nr:hydrogenase maturation protease [Anaerolineae bacterium]
MASFLLIPYGNASRRDDGVAFHIARRLLERLGLEAEDVEGTSTYDVHDGLTIMGVHQLAPELAQDLAEVDVVVFIDAHVPGMAWDDVHWERIEGELRPSMVTHLLKPESVLALCEALYQRSPKAYVLSVLGTDFDFGMALSEQAQALVDPAVDKVLDLMGLSESPEV